MAHDRRPSVNSGRKAGAEADYHMSHLPDRFCEICGAIHQPTIHDTRTCYPGKHGGRIYFSAAFDPEYWPSDDEIAAGVAYWDAVFTDKGTKRLS
jgi:hypothetical protein